MSTHETFKQRAECFCKQGYVEREFYSPDNPYSKCWTGKPAITCAFCEIVWCFSNDDVLTVKEDLQHEGTAIKRHRLNWQMA